MAGHKSQKRIDDAVREEAKGSHELGYTDLCYSHSRPDLTLRSYDG